MAIRRSQMNSLLPPARRERDGLLSDIFQVSLQDEEQIVAGQPRGPLRWARDGELGQATPGGHLNEPSLSLRLFLKHPFGSARFSLTTLPNPPCSAPAPPRSFMMVIKSHSQTVPNLGHLLGSLPPPTPRVLYCFYGKRNVSLLFLHFLYSSPPRLSVTIGSGACGSRPSLSHCRERRLSAFSEFLTILISHVN